MDERPAIDLAASHRYFSAHCYNQVWTYIDNPSRSREEDEAMLHAAHASVWHWAQRPDQTPQNVSIGYWLLARVHALIGDGPGARRFGERSLAASRDQAPFFQGYAWEALARAELLMGNQAAAVSHLEQARNCLDQVTEAEERSLLQTDLDQLAT